MKILKATAVLALLLLSGLAALFVMEIITLDKLRDMATKVVLLVAILGATGLVLAALLGKSGGTDTQPPGR